MQLFIEEYISAFFILTVLLQQICWHSPFKPSYLPWPFIEEYFLAFLHLEKWAEEPIFDRWIDTIGWIWTDRSMVIVLISILWSMIDTIDQREKIFYRWIDTISGQHDQKYRSIASISIYRSIADYAHLWSQLYVHYLVNGTTYTFIFIVSYSLYYLK